VSFIVMLWIGGWGGRRGAVLVMLSQDGILRFFKIETTGSRSPTRPVGRSTMASSGTRKLLPLAGIVNAERIRFHPGA
jgi:hypothetical protein